LEFSLVKLPDPVSSRREGPSRSRDADACSRRSSPAPIRAEVAAFGQDSAMGRPAQPEELSPAFVFLASPVMSSYVNGIVLPVMGGPKG